MTEISTLSSISRALTICVACGALAGADIACPPTVQVNEKIDGPAGWTVQSTSRKASLVRASVLNRRAPNGPEYDLVPSSTVEGKQGNVTQVWKLSDYREMPIVLRCHYRNTGSVLNVDLPGSLQTCTSQVRLDAKGNVLGESRISCK